MSVQNVSVIRQCLSLLPVEDLVSPILDYRKQKLTTAHLLRIFIVAQWLQWSSLDWIEKEIRSDTCLQEEFGVDSISKSQLSRRMNQVPVEVCESLFTAVLQQIQERTRGQSSRATPLALVDSTNIRLPLQLADWAYASKHRSGVRIHTRLMVIEGHMPYPDRIVPSTGRVSDYEGSDLLVVDPGVLYIMDRGYVCYKRMQQWVTQKLDFVIRIHNHHHAQLVEEHPLPADKPMITRDATVIMGNNARTNMTSCLRLVEFVDEQGRLYRILTTRWELSACEVAELYRQRWKIELFFKWMKQHLKFAQLYSYQPEAVWNHIFLALVAFGLSYVLKMNMPSKRSHWDLLKLIRIYATKSWAALAKEWHRPPSRSSKGRQRSGAPPRPYPVTDSDLILWKDPKKKKPVH